MHDGLVKKMTLYLVRQLDLKNMGHTFFDLSNYSKYTH